MQLYHLDSNGKQTGYYHLICVDLDLTQYLHGILEEETYTKLLAEKKRNFPNNGSKKANIQE